MKSTIKKNGLTKSQFTALRKKMHPQGAAIALDIEENELFICEPAVTQPGNLNSEYYVWCDWMPYSSFDEMDYALYCAIEQAKEKGYQGITHIRI